MNSDYFIEDCFALTPKATFSVLNDVMEIGPVMYKKPHPDVDYWLDPIWDPEIVYVSVRGGDAQPINVEWRRTTYGERPYFQCPCGKKVVKLYLPPNDSKFKCRSCHHLRYRGSVINTRSVAGQSIQQMRRMEKLVNTRFNISRIFYNGEYTKRFERFLRQCDRAGLKSVVEGAALMKVLLGK